MVVDTPADMVNSVEPGFFDDTSSSEPVIDTSAETTESPEAEVIETPGDIENAPSNETELPEEEGDEEETPVEAAPVDPNKPAAEALPDGVSKGKDRNGKEGLFVEPKRWESVYGNHKVVQEVANLIGEPITADSLKEGGALWLRDKAFQAQELTYDHIKDPGKQSQVLGHYIDHLNQARESGEIGSDATVPFAQNFYASMKEKSPDGIANLQLMAARDTIGALFEKAAKSGDNDLRVSLQHVVKALTGGTDAATTRAIAERMGLPFYNKDEMVGLAKGADPVALLRQENEALKAQVNGRSTTTQAAQLQEWKEQTWQSMQSGVSEDAVQPALADVADAWKAFPAEYKTHVVDALHSKVEAILNSDPALKNRISALQSRAKLATSAQVRQQLATEIRTAWVNRAKLAADASLRPVLESANKILTGLSNANHARRQQAQGRTAPTRGAQGPVNRGIRQPGTSSMTNGIFDPAAAYNDGLAVL